MSKYVQQKKSIIKFNSFDVLCSFVHTVNGVTVIGYFELVDIFEPTFPIIMSKMASSS